MPAIDRSLRLPAGEYFDEVLAKSGIAIHHTVGGTAKSTFDWWVADRTAQGTRRRVGTAYLIARDGTIHEVFNPKAWAYQFGLTWAPVPKHAFEKRFIGIELASFGPLIEDGGAFYCFDRVSARTRVNKREVFDFGQKWRGYRYWSRYPKVQVDALVELVNDLHDRFRIPRKVPSDFLRFYGEELADFQGVIGHTMVRVDKTDPCPDVDFWKRVVERCGLTSVKIGATPEIAEGTRMTDAQRAVLARENAVQLDALDPAAAGLVLSFLDEIERRGTYVRLRDAVRNGNAVGFDFLEGDAALVARVAKALGFKSWDAQRLEAHGG